MNKDRRMSIIKDELLEIKKHGDERRNQLLNFQVEN